MIFDNVCSFFSYLNASHISLAPVQGFSLMVTTHNSTALKENGMTEDIFIYTSFRLKKFCIWSSGTKTCIYPCNFSVSFFSSSGTHQSYHLDECQAMGKSSSFIKPLWTLCFLFIFIIINIPMTTIIIIIVITPHPHPLLFNKPISNKLQGRRVFF